MSFSVWVEQPHERRPLNFEAASEQEIEAWQAFEQTFVRLEAPIAPDGLFYDFYASIAAELGLPLLSQAYAQGLESEAPDVLAQLLHEVEAVEAEWLRRDFQSQWQDDLRGPSRWERLQEGAADLKQAIQIAIQDRLRLHLG